MDEHMSNKRQDEIRRIAERASEWLEVLEEGAGPRERAAFSDWIAESPLHVREFLNIAAIDRLLANVDGGALELDRIDSNIVALSRKPPRASRKASKSWAWVSGIAAAIAAFGVFIWWDQIAGWREYSTDVGEQSTVELADGTVMNINAESRLQVRFTQHERKVRLMAGEALFSVERDPARPFRVGSGDALIQVIGTRFNVNRRATGTRVYVVEGRVQVSSLSTPPQTLAPAKPSAAPKQTAAVAENRTGVEFLDAGEEAQVVADGRILKRTAVESAEVMAWRERRLVFKADTLQDIVTEFNRYNSSPKVRIEGAVPRDRRFTGVLDADKPESLVRFLSREPDLAVERQPDEIVVRPR